MDSSVTEKALRKLVGECVRCHANGSLLTSATVEESSTAELVHIQCASCQGALIALVFSTGELIKSVGLVSDLSLKDIRKFQHAKPITEDDVIEVHKHFARNNTVNHILKNY